MKPLVHHLSSWACGLLAAATMTACVYEDEVPCPRDLHFVYDMNMEFADAFPTQVGDVMLLLFDADGRYIGTQTDDSPALQTPGYTMTLDHLAPGRYQLLCWAGLGTDANCYSLTAGLTPGQSTLADVQLTLNGVADSQYDRNPADVWHGLVSDFTIDPTYPATDTVRLTKDTNHFRIALQSTAETLQSTDYSFALTAANHCLNSQNLPADHTPEVTYRPYTQRTETVDNAAGNPLSVVVAELATLRLMADRTQRFVVRNEREGRTLFDVDLIRYLDLMRLDQYADMPLQEFLDRENTWNIILMVDSRGVLMSIQINWWTMVFNETEL